MAERYDVVVIGSGAGGGTLAHRLAGAGKRVLVLERGQFLPREKENWDTVQVFQKERYHTHETWLDKRGHEFHPGVGYWVGGNTKVYGGALFRLRERDFGIVEHKGGVSPAWPLTYQDFAPYYTQAEKLYQVHGRRGLDPTEPAMSEDYPFPPVSHEPRIQELHDGLAARGYKPFYTPLGVRLNEVSRLTSPCIRCNTCDGFPCLVDAKADADISCVRPAMETGFVTVRTGAKVSRLLTSATGREITGVEAEVDGAVQQFQGTLVVLAAGSANSAAVLLRSANDKHPTGLANRSDQVGRNFMKHNNAAILAISKKPNGTVFQKTLAFNDLYFGEKDFTFPLGHVSLVGKANRDMIAGDAPFFTPGTVLGEMTGHSVDWWLTNEDLPSAENRVRVVGEKIELAYTENNQESFDRLLGRWTGIIKDIDDGVHVVPHSLYLRKKIPLAGVAHQVGTCRFGDDPGTSVLNRNCQAHDVDNLYVVDGSFFPSSGAVNPSLTIIANALRVGDHLINRLR